MMRSLLSTVVGTMAVLMGVFTPGAQASHSWPDAEWGYLATWYDLYPERSGHVSWKAWTISAGAVPTRDLNIITSVVDNTWEPMFDYALVAGGFRQFDFQKKAYNASAEAKYARMDTADQVIWFCGDSTAVACLALESSVEDSSRDRLELTGASIIYGPFVYGSSDAVFKKYAAHEWGHGFGLAHHAPYPNCETVMSQGTCTNLPSAADVATALDTVYDY